MSGVKPWHGLKMTDVMSAKACIDHNASESLQNCRHNLPEVEPGPVPGAHLPGAKALAGSFAMSRFAGDSALDKTPAKAFNILSGLLPLVKCNISCSVSNLMVDFPPLCKQDPPEVCAAYVYDHWKATGEIIKYSDIPDTVYGGSLQIASKKRKSKKKAASEAAEEEVSEPKPKKAKKEKDATQVQEVGSAMPTIQEEAVELEPTKILNKRTRGGTSNASSTSIPPQPTIPKKKRKHGITKMKV